MNDWPVMFLHAGVVAVIVRTIVQEEIFREPRECLQRVSSDRQRCLLTRKLAYMMTCEFCSSFWVTLFYLVGLFQYRLVVDDWRGYVVSVFCVMGLANVYMAIFSLLRIDLRKERAVASHVEGRHSA
jgi:hypothetical protein